MPGIIGTDDDSGGTITLGGGTPGIINTTHVYTAVAGDQVTEWNYRRWWRSGAPSFCVYDISATGGGVDPAGAPLVFSEVVDINDGIDEVYTVPVSVPFSLTAGNIYAIAFTEPTATMFGYQPSGGGNGYTQSSASPIAADPWATGGLTGNLRTLWATVVSGGGGGASVAPLAMHHRRQRTRAA